MVSSWWWLAVPVAALAALLSHWNLITGSRQGNAWMFTLAQQWMWKATWRALVPVPGFYQQFARCWADRIVCFGQAVRLGVSWMCGFLGSFCLPHWARVHFLSCSLICACLHPASHHGIRSEARRWHGWGSGTGARRSFSGRGGREQWRWLCLSREHMPSMWARVRKAGCWFLTI